MVDKLSSRDDRTLKMATYTLQRLIREPPFTAEFIRRGGLAELIGVVHAQSSGNTLAYALTSCQNLLEATDDGAQGLDGAFMAKVVRILVETERINVCRPATAILKKLVVAGPSTEPHSAGSAGSRSSGSSAGGFGAVFEKIRKEPAFLPTLVHRLASADATLCLYSLSLLNSLMRHVTDALFDDFSTELEKLGTSAAVARLMDSTRGEELATSILEYQNNIIRVLHHRLVTPVTPTDKRHVTALTYIWRQAKITEEATSDSPARMTPSSSTSSSNLRSSLNNSDVHAQGEAPPSASSTSSSSNRKIKWRKLGFQNENVARDFTSTGWLGLECCDAYIRTDPESYSQDILEQLHRPEIKRCPWGRASTAVVEMLADHWGISEGYSTAAMGFKPYLLSLPRVHYLAVRFFLRIWTESGAVSSDFPRVAALVRSQVRYALRDEQGAQWADVRRYFLEAEYRSVRDRQMRELEMEDDYASQPAIRSLRARLYRESYDFVRTQRVQCLLEGAWFRTPSGTRFGGTMPASSTAGTAAAGGSAAPTVGRRRSSHGITPPTSGTSSGSKFAAAMGSSSNSTTPASSQPVWRFYRLSPNRRYLHYRESNVHDPTTPATSASSAAATLAPVRSGLDDLPQRIDLSKVTDIALHTATSMVPLPGSGGINGVHHTSPAASSSASLNNSFSLLGSPDSSLADLICVSEAQYAEWVDGLSMLRGSSDSTHPTSFGNNSVPPTPTTVAGTAPSSAGGSGSGNAIVHTTMTGEQIQALADIALKVKMLDLTGEKVEVPSSVAAPSLPANLDFWFSDI